MVVCESCQLAHCWAYAIWCLVFCLGTAFICFFLKTDDVYSGITHPKNWKKPCVSTPTQTCKGGAWHLAGLSKCFSALLLYGSHGMSEKTSKELSAGKGQWFALRGLKFGSVSFWLHPLGLWLWFQIRLFDLHIFPAIWLASLEIWNGKCQHCWSTLYGTDGQMAVSTGQMFFEIRSHIHHLPKSIIYPNMNTAGFQTWRCLHILWVYAPQKPSTHRKPINLRFK